MEPDLGRPCLKLHVAFSSSPKYIHGVALHFLRWTGGGEQSEQVVCSLGPGSPETPKNRSSRCMYKVRSILFGP